VGAAKVRTNEHCQLFSHGFWIYVPDFRNDLSIVGWLQTFEESTPLLPLETSVKQVVVTS
jgi:hypothetical protein